MLKCCSTGRAPHARTAAPPLRTSFSRSERSERGASATMLSRTASLYVRHTMWSDAHSPPPRQATTCSASSRGRLPHPRSLCAAATAPSAPRRRRWPPGGSGAAAPSSVASDCICERVQKQGGCCCWCCCWALQGGWAGREPRRGSVGGRCAIRHMPIPPHCDDRPACGPAPTCTSQWRGVWGVRGGRLVCLDGRAHPTRAPAPWAPALPAPPPLAPCSAGATQPTPRTHRMHNWGGQARAWVPLRRPCFDVRR